MAITQLLLIGHGAGQVEVGGPKPTPMTHNKETKWSSGMRWLAVNHNYQSVLLAIFVKVILVNHFIVNSVTFIIYL